MKKRLLALFLALALCLGLAVPAFAANSGTSATLGWRYPEGFPVEMMDVLKYKVRLLDDRNSKYKEAEDDEDTEVLLVPTSEEFSVGVVNVNGFYEMINLQIAAVSDPDNDGVYDQRAFEEKRNADGSVYYDAAPIPEDGAAYKNGLERSVNPISVPGFEQGKGDTGEFCICSAARLHELFGDNTIILFWSDETYLGAMLLSAGAFDDVAGRAYYGDKVKWAVDKGITKGVDEDNFDPLFECTQLQILTFLSRAAGNTNTTDYNWEEEQKLVIEWAKEKGMIGDNFDGGKPCSRIAAVTYMWQAAGKPDAKASNFMDLDGYSEDYVKAVNWANEQKVTQGVAEGQFAPSDICNRAQIVTFLQRAYDNK